MAASSVAALSLLLVLPLNSTLFLQSPCLSDNFYGHYKLADSTVGIFKVSTPECIEDSQTRFSVSQATTLVNPPIGSSLLWLEQEAVDDALLQTEPFTPSSFYDSVLGLESTGANGQSVLHLGDNEQRILFSSEQAILVAMRPQAALEVDTILPRFWRSTLLPESPSTYRVVSDDAVEPVRRVLETLRFNPDIASVVNNISLPQIRQDIRFLTGEDGESGILSRHSFTTGALTAAAWIKKNIEESGANCRLELFLEGFAPNVICRYSATKETNDTIIISGHYDSRGSFGSARAPGGDDDGSGTTGILSIARTIGRKKILFHKNVELVTFAGEEQGLLGSRAYARELRAQNASVILMIQADMTAYRRAQEPLQLGLPERIGTPEVTQLIANVSALYSPELRVGYSGACCSDHQSFWEQGFPASQVFERAGPIVDPMYHNSGDLSDREGFDFNQLYAIAKVQFASVLHTAGFEFAAED
ncbi:Zn-dependent exopeptidase [Coprinopsis marcescibilis]|uniref:Peptide hydrolase n=1 Tax=Coprinopsis marcescibilis TaxID=230819 RepID=A0A5C3KKB5_COPMA|nr:Zn-dependent exopeptidase [Coprinopsis marcescibilis]